ncbi:polysaccharide biosynthesis/export family protein [Desulfotalea psychrophila]|nr:polysaccharide biosynthesis/export family protein [Desulfotalea psychrophila]
MKRDLIVLLLIVIWSSSAQASLGYKLGAGDIISVSVFAGGEEQVQVALTVSDSGKINAPFVGSIHAAGATPSDLEKRLYTKLAKDYFINPQVIIQVDGYHSLHYTISGAVTKAGKYKMQSATTVMELIAKAGGVTSERGSLAYVMRESNRGDKESKPLKVNLTKLLDEGDMSGNLRLETGDSIYIPLAKGLRQGDSMVYVGGRIKNPGLQEYQPGLTALSICLMAGGFDDYAAPNRAIIVRTENNKQKVIKVNLEDVVDGKIPDYPLQPGDRLNVPESWF